MFLRRTLIALVPILALGACTTLSPHDQSLLSSASENAEQAKVSAQQASSAAQGAEEAAKNAETAANESASECKVANEKLGHMFRHSLKKVSPTQ